MVISKDIEYCNSNPKIVRMVANLFEENSKGQISDSKLLRQQELIELSEKLYELMFDRCWMAEETMAEKLNTSERQVKNAKALLEIAGKIEIRLVKNGRRDNPKHSIRKIKPSVKETSSFPKLRNINWNVLDEFSAKDFQTMTFDEQLDVYKEMNLPFIPLHYPKFHKKGYVYCSCNRGKNCSSPGKHPAIHPSNYDFYDKSIFRLMREQWEERDVNFNIGLLTGGFTVFDIDMRNGGHYSLEELEEIYGALPRSLVVKTGGGFHIYLQGVTKTTVNLLGLPGIDIRSTGGLVVAPGSQHYSGGFYEWQSISIPEHIPTEWLDAINNNGAKIPKSRKSKTALQDTQPINFGNSEVPDGHRHLFIFRRASAERGNGKGYLEILETLEEINEEQCRPPLPKYDLECAARYVVQNYIPNSLKGH